MKNTRLIFSLSLALLFVAVSCNDDDFVEYGNEFFQEVTDPYLQVLTPVIGFQAGTPSYTIEFNVVNGSKRITDVAVYSIFTDAVSGLQSNEVLLGTYPLGSGQVTHIVDELTYAELKNGLTVNGAALPENEVDLAIGSGWIFRFVGRRGEGDIPLPGNIRVGVLSRFAGNYEVIESKYYRIGVLTAEWTGQTRFIGSVDANTFSYNDFWGNFAWGGKSFHFRVDESDNSIQVPITVDGIFSGTRALDCGVEPQTFLFVSCAGSNVLIPDEVGGHHIIKLTYGYFNDADGGTREFQETLRKL